MIPQTQKSGAAAATPIEEFRRDVLAGLAKQRKTLPCKYLYDERGSRLFEEITTLEEYYPTRTEIAILKRHGEEMAHMLGRGVVLVELGSGSSTKTPLLLQHLEQPAAYVPVDISHEHLEQSAAKLAERFPLIPVHPLTADYTKPIQLPKAVRQWIPRAAFFPGSTIGNFTPPEASQFLGRVRAMLGDGGVLLVGVDLRKDPAVLERAYNDAKGITARFNLNLLNRIASELGADAPLECFEHRALFNEQASRIEMHLFCKRACTMTIPGEEPVSFIPGESIHTENSYKYTRQRFASMAEESGFVVDRVWTDPAELFSMHALRALP